MTATAGRDRLVAAALAAGALALYVRTLLPGVGFSGDTAKWQFIGRVGGTPHPTGYPLYLMLDRAAVTLVPVGSTAWRANLLSALFGAATVGVLHLLQRELGVRPAVAAATAATFAVTTTFWTHAVVAEVYTLHLWFLATVTLCLARWAQGGPDGWLLAGLGLLALSFGNHLGTVLALPGVAWLLWRDRRRALTTRTVACAALFAAVGAAQYGYLVWMTDVGRYVEERVYDVGDVLGLVTGGHFRDQMFTFTPGELLTDRVPLLARLARRELGLLLVPAAYGVVRGLRAGGARRAVAVHLLLLGLCAAVYGLNFDVVDVVVFFLPCFLVAVVFLGLGLDGLAGHLAAALDRRSGAGAGAARWRPAAQAASVALALLPVALGVAHHGAASQRGNVGDARRVERALAAAEPGAVVVTDNYADSEYVWYYLLAEGWAHRRDLRLGNQLAPAQVVRFLEGRGGPLGRLAGVPRPVYTATPHQAVTLAATGLTVTPVAQDVWRVELPPDGGRRHR